MSDDKLYLGFYPEMKGKLCDSDNEFLRERSFDVILELEDRLDYLKVISQLVHDEPGRKYAQRLRRLVSDFSGAITEFLEEDNSEITQEARALSPDLPAPANVTPIK